MRFSLCGLLIALSAFAAPQPPALRLNHDVEPRHFALDLQLDPAQDQFSGSVVIDVDVREAVDHFWLNATNLQVTEVQWQAGGKTLAPQIIAGGDDFVGFQFPAPLREGSGKLTVRYRGKVNLKSSDGVFRSSYKNEQYLFTQFEPIDARRAFPCFDEPGFKIPWQLTLHVPAGQMAVANTGIESETPEGSNRKTVRFRETKPLPSYLIAFAVGPLEFVDAGRAGKNQVPVRIVVPRGDGERAQYAASVTAEILTRLENYFAIPYPYDKADQLAVPLSFGGAMENPGLVTYDASIILSPPGTDAEERRRKYAAVAAHELSHQWFGDMVTMAWWNDVWLNESFATWSSANLLAHWKPEWQTRTDNQTARLQAVAADMQTTARRINQPAETKSDIGNAFDAITYLKGGSVLAMFENAIGPDRFQKAVHNYLNAHLFANARAEDFLAAIAQNSDPQYATAFATFLNQNGVPQVNISLQCQENNAPVLHVEQKRLVPVGSPAQSDQRWSIPLCAAYSYGSEREQTCRIVKDKQADIALSGKGCPAWLLANSQQVGYYEAIYPPGLLSQLVSHRQQLTLAEQTGLFEDVHTLSDAGTVPLDQALRLVSPLANDPHYQIASVAIDLATIRAEFIPADLRQRYSDFISSTFKARAEQIGWKAQPNEGEEVTLLRPPLVGFVAAATGDVELVKQAKTLAVAWLADHNAVPANLVQSMLNVTAEYGDAKLFDQFVAAAKTEQDTYFKMRLIEALGHFRDRDLAGRALQLTLTDTFDARLTSRIFRAMTEEADNTHVAYEFTKAHYDELLAKLPRGIGTDYAAALPQWAISGSCSAADQADVKAFYSERMQKVQGGPRSLANAVEAIGTCAAQRPAAERELRSFLEGGGAATH